MTSYDRRQLVEARNTLERATHLVTLAIERLDEGSEPGFRAAFARKGLAHADTLLRRYVNRSGVLAG
jgi:hypothetical protein